MNTLLLDLMEVTTIKSGSTLQRKEEEVEEILKGLSNAESLTLLCGMLCSHGSCLRKDIRDTIGATVQSITDRVRESKHGDN